MNFIDNLLNQMSSTFNQQLELPKQAEISMDETFKWRALKNNQFASRSKGTRSLKDKPEPENSELSEAPCISDKNEITACAMIENLIDSTVQISDTNVEIEIAKDISGDEIREAVAAFQVSTEFLYHDHSRTTREVIISNGSDSLPVNSEQISYPAIVDKHDERILATESCSIDQNIDKTKIHSEGDKDQITVPKPTDQIISQMSSTFNIPNELISNSTPVKGNSKRYGRIHGKLEHKHKATSTSKLSKEVIRRSNRLNNKELFTDAKEKLQGENSIKNQTIHDRSQHSINNRNIKSIRTVMKNTPRSKIESSMKNQTRSNNLPISVSCSPENSIIIKPYDPSTDRDNKETQHAELKINHDQCTPVIAIKSQHINNKSMKKAILRRRCKMRSMKQIRSKHPRTKAIITERKRKTLKENESSISKDNKKSPLLRGRLSRPIKLSAKILANSELRQGFELQNSVRLSLNTDLVQAQTLPEIPKEFASSKPKTPKSTNKSSSINSAELEDFGSTPTAISTAPLSAEEYTQVLGKNDHVQSITVDSCHSKDDNQNASTDNLELKEKHFLMLGLVRSHTIEKSLNASNAVIKCEDSNIANKAMDKSCPTFGNKKGNNSRSPIIQMKNSNSSQKKSNLTNVSHNDYHPMVILPPDYQSKHICYCRKRTRYFTTKTKSRTFCTATDSVDGEIFGCRNLLNGDLLNLLRPSKETSYQLFCNAHHRRFRNHGCCPFCGVFCLQGDFGLCFNKHLFHWECAERLAVPSKFSAVLPEAIYQCPHCGLESHKSKYTFKVQLPTEFKIISQR
ncbi:uncharacterized protein LOC129754395 [Uranotaenia lowii]|uniref:uncharacterized protein LOC129754395 n=1 Tax=Uranotaenia lowii TaxID=190385 RepID=UPI00247981DB|nr:uncharacterized protein LOC129754395 [Uranotaenia lowii]